MYLCIDTISSAAGITLVYDQGVHYLPLDPKNASEGIIPTIDAVLKKLNIKPADLKGIFVIKGPGSFTGLRVGLSVANQFAHQLKIPIIGLRTDEWWLYRSEESSLTYLQSMNRAEVYMAKDGKHQILAIEALKPCKWLGQLTEDHRQKLSEDFEEITELSSVEDTWKKVVENLAKSNMEHKTYELVEPFYGKEPAITKSKKKLSIN